MPAAKLQTVDLHKHFWRTVAGRGESTKVLEGISLDVARGEFVAIVGASGSGKTTFLHIVDGLTTPSSGRVLVDGHEVDAPGRDRAIVFQDASLLPWRTTLGNAAYGLECLGRDARTAREEAERSLRLVGLDGFGQHYPHQLSGGMRQRVNLARALAVNPDILLMDEPFAALDALTREGMQAELLSIWRRTGNTVLFVTHQIDEAIYLADRVVVFTPRPARVQEVIAIDLPRPRDRSTRRSTWLRDCEDHIRDLLQPDLPGE